MNHIHIGGLVQERRNSIANAQELRLSCTSPSIYTSFRYDNSKQKLKYRSVSWLTLSVALMRFGCCSTRNLTMSACSWRTALCKRVRPAISLLQAHRFSPDNLEMVNKSPVRADSCKRLICCWKRGQTPFTFLQFTPQKTPGTKTLKGGRLPVIERIFVTGHCRMRTCAEKQASMFWISNFLTRRVVNKTVNKLEVQRVRYHFGYYGVTSVGSHNAWAFYQIREITGCAGAGNAGNVFPVTVG